MSFYDEIADYYDLIFPFNRAQIDFVKSSIEKPYHNKALLDVGCGTGDLAIALSEIDFHVTGIDSDAEMLRKARAKAEAHERVEFVRMDMRKIADSSNEAGFHSVLCFGNTLVHLNSFSEIEAFCKNVKAVLRSSGKFLLQILNYDHILDHNVTKLPLIENNVVKFERQYEYDDKRNLIAFKTILTAKDTTKRIENEILLYPLRKRELETALRNGGFSSISCYADFDKSELKPESLPLVAEAS